MQRVLTSFDLRRNVLALVFSLHQITVIVMITSLTEGNIKKADKYWPDEENPTIKLEGNIELKYVDTSYQGTYFLRYSYLYIMFPYNNSGL